MADVSVPAVSSKDEAAVTSSEDQHQFRAFGLLIGINQYKSNTIPNLAGCENDVNSFGTFLTNKLNVPSSHIAVLLNEHATRDAIISTFRSHLIDNPKINKGDAIVLFYAGHGSRVQAPQGWVSDNSKIETICPHDQKTRDVDGDLIHGIPDRTINALLRRLSFVKGDNITVIFDSCHSGGIARDLSTGVRSIQTITPLPQKLDRSIWTWEAARHGSTVLPAGFAYDSLSSHVLLAACRQEENAHEVAEEGQTRGLFTKRLVKALNGDIQTTYLSLFDSVFSLLRADQHPVCEGTNKNRILFKGTVVGRHVRAFKVANVSPGVFRADAGTIHGVDKGTEFLIYSNDIALLGETELGILVAVAVQGHTCDLAHRPEDQPFAISAGAKALMSTGTSQRLLKVFFQPNNDQNVAGDFQHTAVTEIEDCIEEHFTRVTSRAEAHIAVSRNASGTLQLEGVDDRIPSYANPTLKDVAPKRLLNVLDAIAHFNFHFHRESNYKSFKKNISVHMHRLEEDEGEEGEPLYNLVNPGKELSCDQQNIICDLGTPHCLMLENRSHRDLFPYVFYFDPSDYSIQAWYVPPGHTISPPFAAGQQNSPSVISVGYGSTSGDPIYWGLDPGETSDTGFLKVFVSTAYVNMDMIRQNSPLDDQSRKPYRPTLQHKDIWGALTFELTCRLPDL